MKLFILFIALPAILLAGNPPLKRFALVVPKQRQNVIFNAEPGWKLSSTDLSPNMSHYGFDIGGASAKDGHEPPGVVLFVWEAVTAEEAQSIANGVGVRSKDCAIKKYQGWEVFSYTAPRDGTTYSQREAYRIFPGFVVVVRLSWPNWKENPSDVSSVMEASFWSLIDSIRIEKK